MKVLFYKKRCSGAGEAEILWSDTHRYKTPTHQHITCLSPTVFMKVCFLHIKSGMSDTFFQGWYENKGQRVGINWIIMLTNIFIQTAIIKHLMYGRFIILFAPQYGYLPSKSLCHLFATKCCFTVGLFYGAYIVSPWLWGKYSWC